MDWNKTLWIFIAGILFFLKPTIGQSFETGLNIPIGIAHNDGFETGANGLSLQMTYLQQLRTGFSAHGGMEFGYTGWGSQLLLPLGVRLGETNQLDLEFLNGVALYHQGGHYIGGAGAYYVYPLFRDKKHRMVLSAGLRFTIQPAYRNYGSQFFYLDLPLRIRWQFGQ